MAGGKPRRTFRACSDGSLRIPRTACRVPRTAYRSRDRRAVPPLELLLPALSRSGLSSPPGTLDSDCPQSPSSPSRKVHRNVAKTRIWKYEPNAGGNLRTSRVINSPAKKRNEALKETARKGKMNKMKEKSSETTEINMKVN